MNNYRFSLQDLANMAAGRTQQAPMDAKEAVNASFLQGTPLAYQNAPGLLGQGAPYFSPNVSQTTPEDYVAQSQDVLDELSAGQTPSTPQVAGTAAANVVTKATGDKNLGQAVGEATAEEAANATTPAPQAAPQGSAPTQAAPTDVQGLLGAYQSDSPVARAFAAQYMQDVVAPQVNRALLPYREAQYKENDAAIRRADPDTVMGLRRQLINGLAKAKATYDQAKAAGNEQGMALAHQAGDMIRQQAASIGLDLGDYGGNEDAQSMAQALANNDARAMAKIIDNDLTPEQYFQQVYNEARDSGLGRRGAQKYAQHMAESYQAERNARMQSAFYTYGIHNGAITPYGMQILTKWAAGEDPQAFLGITTKAFGLPIDEYKLGNQRTLLSDKNKYTMTQNEQMHGFNMDELEKKIAGELARTNLEGQWKFKTTDLNGKYGLAAAEIRGANRGGGSSSSGGGSSSSGKLSAGQNEIVNKATNLLNDVKTGNADPSELHDYVYSDEVREKLSPDDLDSLRSLDYAAQFYFYKNHGYDGGDSDSSDRAMYNVCAHIANDTSPEWRDAFLPDYNFDAWVGVKPIGE